MQDATLFTAGQRPFSIADTLEFAQARGSIDRVREDLAEGLACREYARESGYELGGKELQSAVERWRYARELISAQHTLAWLGHCGLGVDDLSDQLEIGLWRDRFPGERERIRWEYPPDRADLQRALRPALLISPRLDEASTDLAAHAAAVLECCGAMPDRPLAGLLSDLDAGFAELRGHATLPDQRRRHVALSRLALLRVALETATFATQDTAQEALLCVRCDGEELEDVARQACVHYESGLHFVDELPTELRARCLSASPGEVFVMPERDGVHPVLRLRQKCEPELGDEAVRKRVDEQLLESALAVLLERHVKWDPIAFRRPPRLTTSTLQPLEP